MNEFLPEYWSQRYQEGLTGWDLKGISTPIKEYVDQLRDENIKILIPGCGYGYEGEYLFRSGFKHVHLLDFSPEPLIEFKKRLVDFPEEQLHVGDFFQHDGKYDLIIEQTFFCALDPSLRHAYALKMAELLKPRGKLVGVLFNREFEGGPPFGGTEEEYLTYFRDYFSEISMEPCYNSIEPRKGTESFMILIR